MGGGIAIGGFWIPAYMVVAALLYGTLASGARLRIGRSLPRRVAEKNEAEARFRFALTRLRENLEAVALLGGADDERRAARARLAELVARWRAVVRQSGRLTRIVNGNAVLGITAAPREHESYVRLAIARTETARAYWVLFGDVYQLDGRLSPELDVATLFHLGEFWSEKNAAYGAMTDRELALLLLDRLVPGGWLLFYTGSFAYDKAGAIADALEAEGRLLPVGRFASLRLGRKPGG